MAKKKVATAQAQVQGKGKRAPVSFLPGIPTGELSPEARVALKANNPEAYAGLLQWEAEQANQPVEVEQVEEEVEEEEAEEGQEVEEADGGEF